MQQQPIFTVDPVEFQPQNPICHAVVSSHKLVLGLENGQICIINLQKAAAPDYLNVIPSTMGSGSPIRKMFLDPSGRHLIIGTKSLDYYYLFLPDWKKAKPLTKFKVR